jgi:transposase
MSATITSPHGRRYPAELRETSSPDGREAIAESGEREGAVTRIARPLGVAPENHCASGCCKRRSMEVFVPSTISDDKARIQQLGRENRDLRRANEILKSESACLAGADPRPPRP